MLLAFNKIHAKIRIQEIYNVNFRLLRRSKDAKKKKMKSLQIKTEITKFKLKLTFAKMSTYTQIVKEKERWNRAK